MRLPSTIIQVALACALLLIRVPSLAQPMGGDQALYAYVGEQIRSGGLPYRDAWDQKPPAIHFLYAGLRTIWGSDGVVALADLLAAAAVAWLLWRVSPAKAGHYDAVSPAQAGHYDAVSPAQAGHYDAIAPAQVGHYDAIAPAQAGHCDAVSPAQAGHYDAVSPAQAGHYDAVSPAQAGHYDAVSPAQAGHYDAIGPAQAGHYDAIGPAQAGHYDAVAPAQAGHYSYAEDGSPLESVVSGFSRTSVGVGAIAALIFLFLSNPSFTRLGGIRLRAQCETFIAVILVAALLLLIKHRDRASNARIVGAGVLFGLAFTFKYNVAIFAGAGVVTLWLWNRLTLTDAIKMTLGFCLPVVLMLIVFALGGALGALYDATILYNLQYSGETYAGRFAVVRYLMAFPIERARADALWTVGGTGCVILIASALASRHRGEWRDRLVPVVWVAAACLSIAINGSRSLPQYFIQANPFLALAAASAAALGWQWMKTAFGPMAKLAATGALCLVAVGVWRVNQFPKLVEQTIFDARRLTGEMPRDAYLARYDDDRKYSAIAGATLGEYLAARTSSDQYVYVFGFTSSAYVHAQRVSASRFFWSRPVIAGFKADDPHYGVSGVLAELTVRAPTIVALQHRDWAPDVDDSRAFFMATPSLANWLRGGYHPVSDGPDGFDIWVRGVTP